jgi:drug/metabolite transporter (DMT)-like permease
MRLGTARVQHNYGMLTVNYIVCMCLAAAHTGLGNLVRIWVGRDFTVTLGLGAIAGIIYLVAFVLMQSNIEKNGVVLSSVFMKLGLLVPMLVSVLFFGEVPGLTQILGFLLAVAAIVLINVKKGSGGASSALGLVLLLFAGGCADLMSKVFEELGPAALSDLFLLFTFLFAFLLCKDLVLFKHQRIGRNEIIYGCLVGLPNFYSSKFILRALESLDAVIVYPSFSVGTLLVVTLAGVAFFSERLRKLQWLAVAIILVALALLNM